MLITRRSIISGETNTMEIDVTPMQLSNWHNGMLVQDAMPHLNNDEKEFIMTGITPDEWEDEFSDDDFLEFDEWDLTDEEPAF